MSDFDEALQTATDELKRRVDDHLQTALFGRGMTATEPDDSAEDDSLTLEKIEGALDAIWERGYYQTVEYVDAGKYWRMPPSELSDDLPVYACHPDDLEKLLKINPRLKPLPPLEERLQYLVQSGARRLDEQLDCQIRQGRWHYAP